MALQMEVECVWFTCPFGVEGLHFKTFLNLDFTLNSRFHCELFTLMQVAEAAQALRGAGAPSDAEKLFLRRTAQALMLV